VAVIYGIGFAQEVIFFRKLEDFRARHLGGR
jgi:hypothetical protein